MKKLPFKPEAVTKRLLKNITERSREILERRFGIGIKTIRETLEAIGSSHKITRERVRQIENHALQKLRNSISESEEAKIAFTYLKNAISERGHIVQESDFLSEISEKPEQKNHLHFLLTLGDDFSYLHENDDFHSRWVTDATSQKYIQDSLLRLHESLGDEPLTKEGINTKLAQCLKEAPTGEKKEFSQAPTATLMSWLSISKRITQNPFGEWGLISSPYIKPRGIRDLAYLFMRKHGSPMHFREVATGIEKNLGTRAHQQTVHNELIKDNRFVLVGRGLYALTEWGYQPGVVRDVIKAILEKQGPLTREELIKRVLKERHVKENTILINLQNKQYFKRADEGKYMAA